MKITRKRALKNLSGLATLSFMGLPTVSSGNNEIEPPFSKNQSLGM